MRILICHNTYQIAGGEDTVVAAEQALLKKHGHEVKLYQVSNDKIEGIIPKIQTALQISYSEKAKQELTEQLIQFSPDIVHFHNTFPLLTPSVYDACIEASIPSIQTLHNYRTICPGALLMRDGKICEKCITSSAYNAVKYGCYRDSSLQTLAVAHLVNQHRAKDTWNQKVTRYIALTQFAKNKFSEAGFTPSLIRVKPNFIELNELPKPSNKQSFALFVGRISEEKGIQTLISAFEKNGIPLKVAGDGPLLESLINSSPNNIEILGRQNTEEIYKLMRKAQFMVMPSQWYEGFPMVIVEAFAHGLPVLCSKLGAMEEIITDNETGVHFTSGDTEELSHKANELFNNPEKCFEMGKNAQQQYIENYNADTNYHQLISIYKEAINEYT